MSEVKYLCALVDMKSRLEVIEEYLKETVNLMKKPAEYLSVAKTMSVADYESDGIFLKSRHAVLYELEPELDKMVKDFREYHYNYYESKSCGPEQDDECSENCKFYDVYKNMYKVLLKLREKNREIKLVLDERDPTADRFGYLDDY
ncbi:hypothetical protein V9T40_001743 [Parthenolecanium corni]|uniref:Uncharacterized protein n=1 Tax=Parthenolecanium corni TaxID=536013 RepID=A0AAN9Y4N9_9HEMI